MNARFADGRIIVRTGDITEMNVDAVVNAANSGLMGGGGVDGAIHRKAGPSLLEECGRLRRTELPSGLPPGQAVATGAGKLNARYVIHTVGPVWNGGQHGEAEVLSDAYRNSLEIAASLSCETVAFPAISTGVYGFPKREAAGIAFGTISGYLASHALPRTVYLVLYSDEDRRVFLSAVDPGAAGGTERSAGGGISGKAEIPGTDGNPGGDANSSREGSE